MNQPTALYTCRYWAFSPAWYADLSSFDQSVWPEFDSPNVGTHGENVCKFAHWDTGRLAAETSQRGTCVSWRKGTCGKGQSCWCVDL